MFKYILSIMMLISLVFSPMASAEVNCEHHPIYCQIIENKPSINKTYAMHLSNVIYRYSKLYKIPAKVYTAILAQESIYRISAVNCHTGVVVDDKGNRIEKVCTDFGISQIWWKTALSYGFNLDLLVSDLEYSVEAGAIVLADFMRRYAHSDKFWWTRYNSSQPVNREIYRQLVSRYL